MGDSEQERGGTRALIRRRRRRGRPAQTPPPEGTCEEWGSEHVDHETDGNGDEDNGGGELPAAGEAFRAGKDGSDPSPQSIQRPGRRQLRCQKSSENQLLSFINPDDELEVEVERGLNATPHTKNDNCLSTGQEKELNTITYTNNCSLYNNLSEHEKYILRHYISQSPLPQMKTPIATDIRTRITLWEMKESFNTVPPGYTHANGKIVPSQGDKDELWATERRLRAGRERWIQERINSVRLSTILERAGEEVMEGALY